MAAVRELSRGDAPAPSAFCADDGWWADRDVENVHRALEGTEALVRTVHVHDEAVSDSE